MKNSFYLQYQSLYPHLDPHTERVKNIQGAGSHSPALDLYITFREADAASLLRRFPASSAPPPFWRRGFFSGVFWNAEMSLPQILWGKLPPCNSPVMQWTKRRPDIPETIAAAVEKRRQQILPFSAMPIEIARFSRALHISFVFFTVRRCWECQNREARAKNSRMYANSWRKAGPQKKEDENFADRFGQ
mgnify:CR=1 FL=1